MNKNWIFKNSPFEILDVAFKRLFPNTVENPPNGKEYKFDNFELLEVAE